MNVDISERAFEDAIEATLLRHTEGVIAEEHASYLDMPPGGYRKRLDERLRSQTLPHPGGRAGLCASDAAPRVEAAFAASRGSRGGAVPEEAVL